MRFRALKIKNFKAISSLELEDLKDFILIAGPNGCGKSCILDAIRLLKSAYGGYQPNEWHQWMGEFLIDVNDLSALRRLFRNPEIPLIIEATVELSGEEVSYLEQNMEALIEPRVWRRHTGRTPLGRRIEMTPRLRELGPQFEQEVEQQTRVLKDALREPDGELRLELPPKGSMQVKPNPLLEFVFETYAPPHIGIIDYHSASRNYQRESLGGVDLDVRAFESQRASQALYNPEAKYQNVKTELAATYIRDLVARQAGLDPLESDLNETLKELFRAFFPDKEYLGVVPDPFGSLSFPVRTSAGVHDINELSSGEKEIVYGYLRLRNSAPRNSTILLDEPELHLNPGLLRGMPSFYHQHLGRARSNQLWLVTHSDALLRHAVGNANYSVFHMSPPLDKLENQVAEIVADDELERATMALVGDLATYQPRSRVVILEGGGDTEFDVVMVQRLFPDLAKRINLVSGGTKRHVRDLHELLAATATTVGIRNRFFSIVDRDSDPHETQTTSARRFSWDVYHIENFLLSEPHIRRAANELSSTSVFDDDASVTSALHECAATVATRVVIDRLRREVNSRMVRQIALGGDPQALDASTSLRPAISASFERLAQVQRDLLDNNELERSAERLRREVARAVDDGTWRSELPGRDILKALVSKWLGRSMNYEAFRFAILGRMVDDGHRPASMESVFGAILETESE